MEAAKWFDQEVAATLDQLSGPGADDRCRTIARLPQRMGGLGLRCQADLAMFAHECVGLKGAQRERTALLDSELLTSLLPTLSASEVSILAAGTAHNASCILSDASLRVDDAAFGVYLRQRLLLRVTPAGATCACGEDASNAHLHSCVRIHGGPRAARHDAVVDILHQSFALCGLTSCRVEPTVFSRNRSRPDLTLLTASGAFACDVTVTYPGRPAVSTGRVLEAATRAERAKEAHWLPWASLSGTRFAAFALETTGGVTKKSRRWLRAALATTSGPMSPASAVQWVLGRVAVAVAVGQRVLFDTALSASAVGV